MMNAIKRNKTMNTRKPRILLALGALAALTISGCATVPYDCPLGTECVGTKEVYDAAVSNQGNSESVMGFKKDKKQSQAVADFDFHDTDSFSMPNDSQQAKPHTAQWRPYAGGGLTDKPVYQPPQPVRIWIAPWKASDGLLRSGQFIYATRPGRWTMGEMRSEGVGSQVLRPRAVLKPADQKTAEKRVQPEAQLVPGSKE